MCTTSLGHAKIVAANVKIEAFLFCLLEPHLAMSQREFSLKSSLVLGLFIRSSLIVCEIYSGKYITLSGFTVINFSLISKFTVNHVLKCF